MSAVLVARAPAGEPYRRVLLASDLSAADAEALALVRGRFPEARLHVVHVFQWHEIRPLRLAFVAPEVMERYRRRAQAEAQSLLRRFAAEHGLSSSVALHVALGDVARALRLHAGILGADLLVLSPERSWLKAALGASVTRRLLADPPCDLLLAPRAAERAGETVESAPFPWRSSFRNSAAPPSAPSSGSATWRAGSPSGRRKGTTSWWCPRRWRARPTG